MTRQADICRWCHMYPVGVSLMVCGRDVVLGFNFEVEIIFARAASKAARAVEPCTGVFSIHVSML